MTKNQKIAIAIVTVLLAIAGFTSDIGTGLFGAVVGFGCSYGVVMLLNKRKQITPEEKAQKQALKLQKQQNKSQEKIARQQIKAEKAKVKQAQRAEKQQRLAELQAQANRLSCPHCTSEQVQPVGVKTKGFSVGKAVGGAILTGGVGTLAGFAGKKTNKTTFVCMQCGRQFNR